MPHARPNSPNPKTMFRNSSSLGIPSGIWSAAYTSTLRKTARTRRRHSHSWRPIPTRLSAQATAQHLPLGKALQEYAGAENRERLLSLLMPVQRAAELCGWLKAMVDAGEIFHP